MIELPSTSPGHRSPGGDATPEAASEAPPDPYSPEIRTALLLTGTGTAGAYHAGVLRLEIPVAEAAKPRKITVASIEQETPDHAANGQNAITPAPDQHAVNA